MTRKEALDKLSSIERVEGNWIIGYYLTPTEELINQIYNDHEAQLKLASDVYSTDKMHMYQELKTKDKQIKELNHTVSGLNEMYLEALEIDRLKEQKHNG